MTDNTTSQLSQFSKASKRLAQNLLFPGFDPSEYVKSVSANSDGDRDLEDAKLRITALSDETAKILKRQVYNNYLQFIDTAKEISSLEQEMKQINSILSKQRNVMDKMASILVEDSGVDLEEKLKEQKILKDKQMKEEQQKQALNIILENVENCDPTVIKQNRFLIFDGRVAELNSDTFEQFQEVHLYLMNDVILIATHESIYKNQDNRKRRTTNNSLETPLAFSDTSKRFKFEIMYPLKDIAVVNARDIGPMRNSFKILMFPTHRVFQCTDNKEKKKMVRFIRCTKRKFMQKESENNLEPDAVDKVLKQRTNSFYGNKPSPGFITSTPGRGSKYSPDDLTSGGETPLELNDGEMDNDLGQLDTVWLQEAIEEIDVFVAQRQFKEATELVNTGIKYLREIRSTTEPNTFNDWAMRFSTRRNEMVFILRKDLMVQSTPRMQRVPCSLLVKLLDHRRAAQLLIKARSRIIRQVKPHTGSVVQYIKKLSLFTFTSIAETIRDFTEIFADYSKLYTLLINNFIVAEIRHFADLFKFQAFSSGRSSLTFLETTECYDAALLEIENQINEHVDIMFLLGELLRKEIIDSIKIEANSILDFLKSRLSDETWQHMTDVEKTKETLGKHGIVSSDLVDFIIDDQFVEISGTCVFLTKQLGNFTIGLQKYCDPETARVAFEIIESVWLNIKELIKASVACLPDGTDQKIVAQRSYKFVKSVMLPKFADKLDESGYVGISEVC